MASPRLYVEHTILSAGRAFTLPDGAARHVQVLRLQPGDEVIVFDGQGGEWLGRIAQMGRREVLVDVVTHQAVSRELDLHVTLAVGMPANDRMDALVEKATELGVAAIQPLMCERSVLRLEGDRAAKKVAHWHGVAVAASEQSGRTMVPAIGPVMPLRQWLAQSSALASRAVLSFEPQASLLDWCRDRQALGSGAAANGAALKGTLAFLSGPEGGLSPVEEAEARSAGWTPVGLGPRILRADTAPLMALSCLAALQGSS